MVDGYGESGHQKKQSWPLRLKALLFIVATATIGVIATNHVPLSCGKVALSCVKVSSIGEELDYAGKVSSEGEEPAYAPCIEFQAVDPKLDSIASPSISTWARWRDTDCGLHQSQMRTQDMTQDAMLSSWLATQQVFSPNMSAFLLLMTFIAARHRKRKKTPFKRRRLPYHLVIRCRRRKGNRPSHPSRRAALLPRVRWLVTQIIIAVPATVLIAVLAVLIAIHAAYWLLKILKRVTMSIFVFCFNAIAKAPGTKSVRCRRRKGNQPSRVPFVYVHVVVLLMLMVVGASASSPATKGLASTVSSSVQAAVGLGVFLSLPESSDADKENKHPNKKQKTKKQKTKKQKTKEQKTKKQKTKKQKTGTAKPADNGQMARDQYSDVLQYYTDKFGPRWTESIAGILMKENPNPIQKAMKQFLLMIYNPALTSSEAFKAQYNKHRSALADEMKSVGEEGKYHERINFGDGLRRGINLLIMKHWAPDSCRGYKDIVTGWDCNKIDRRNVCILQFLKVLAKSLHKEAGGIWSKITEINVGNAINFVDMLVLVPEVKKKLNTEIKAYVQLAGITMDEFKLVGFILMAAQIRFIHLVNSERLHAKPLKVLAASKEASREMFGDKVECLVTEYMNYLGYVPHGQCWAMKLPLMNIKLFPDSDLPKINARLVEAYKGIAGLAVPEESFIINRFGARLGHGLTADEMVAKLEVMRQWCVKGGKIAGKQVSDAWDALFEGKATDEQCVRVKASHPYKIMVAWIAYHEDDADDKQMELLEDNLCFKLKMAWDCFKAGDKSKVVMDVLNDNLSFKLKMAWDCYKAGDKSKVVMDVLNKNPSYKIKMAWDCFKAGDKSEAVMDVLIGTLAYETYLASEAKKRGNATSEQKETTKKYDSDLATGRETLKKRRDAVKSGNASEKEKEAIYQQSKKQSQSKLAVSISKYEAEHGKRPEIKRCNCLLCAKRGVTEVTEFIRKTEGRYGDMQCPRCKSEGIKKSNRPPPEGKQKNNYWEVTD